MFVELMNKLKMQGGTGLREAKAALVVGNEKNNRVRRKNEKRSNNEVD